MSRLTLRLPETLHHQLAQLAEGEGISLNQYIVYALTRQATSAYSVQAIPELAITQQREAFNALLSRLGHASPTEVESILTEREVVESEKELSAEAIAKLKKRTQ
jgi:uncharacterized protein (DUF1778 family)